MDPLMGAVIAALAGFASILLAIRLPNQVLPVHAMRPIGGVSLALLGLVVLGVPLPPWLPMALLLLGMAAIAVATTLRRGIARTRRPV